nr:sex comb on midleg-like protein 1 isoform X3 [Manis javanica]
MLSLIGGALVQSSRGLRQTRYVIERDFRCAYCSRSSRSSRDPYRLCSCRSKDGSLLAGSCPLRRPKWQSLRSEKAIYDAIQNLDQKFDVIHKKISKINRSHAKSIWLNRSVFYTGFVSFQKSLRYGYKCYKYLFSKNMKLKRLKRRESYNGDSYSQSYSSTLSVIKLGNDFNSNIVATSFCSNEFCEQDPELIYKGQRLIQEEHKKVEWEPERLLSLNQSTPAPSDTTADSSQLSIGCDDTPDDTISRPCSPNPGAHSTNKLPQSAGFPTVVCAAQPIQATGAPPVRAGSDMLQRSFSDDPESWSVEDVILLLKQKDPQISGLLADSFREHDIDGKALLLLTIDMMTKYMGLKLGMAVKLCHYIEKLKEEHHLDN